MKSKTGKRVRGILKSNKNGTNQESVEIQDKEMSHHINEIQRVISEFAIECNPKVVNETKTE